LVLAALGCGTRYHLQLQLLMQLMVVLGDGAEVQRETLWLLVLLLLLLALLQLEQHLLLVGELQTLAGAVPQRRRLYGMVWTDPVCCWTYGTGAAAAAAAESMHPRRGLRHS